ncbi:MAG: glutamine amidotransferase [Candidatus Dormibacteraeota bacterium]|nr:glutamine amidotransferase [Candidatus Dormibacteraeota bacterium]
MPGSRSLRLGLLYPLEMNLYGDRGNVLALVRRAALRGVELEVRTLGLDTGDPDDIAACSGFLIGGGQDLDQLALAHDLVARKGPALREQVADGAPLLAVCAGYQLLGEHYRTAAGDLIPGLGILPLRTEAGRRRLVGNVLVAANAGLGLANPLLVGFENHSGRTILEPGLSPLGKVVRGRGNDGESGLEGAVLGSVLGTYLHGPLLPKNPALADWWVFTAAERTGTTLDRSQLDDSAEETARREAIRITLSGSRTRGYHLLGRRPRIRRTG